MSTRQSENVAPNRSHGRRRKYVTSPGFQWKYAGLVAFTVFLVSSLAGLMLFGVLHQQARARLLEPVPADPWQNTTTMLLTAMTFAAVMAAVFGLWSVFVTHRICGPLLVMKRFLSELAEGRIPDTRPLRKNDEFRDVYDVLRSAIQTVKAKQQADFAALTDALVRLNSARDADNAARDRTLESLAADIESLCKESASELGVHLEFDDSSQAVPVHDRPGSTSEGTDAERTE